VSRLCERGYWLDRGKVILTGRSEEVVAAYLQMQAGVGADRTWPVIEEAPGDDLVRLRSARIIDETGTSVDAIDVRQPVGIEIGFDVLQLGQPVFPKIKLSNLRGEIAFNALDTDPRWLEPAEPGSYLSTAWIPANLLNEGLMTVDVGVASLAAPKMINHFNTPGLLTFNVHDQAQGGSSKGAYTGELRGAVRPLLDWTLSRPGVKGRRRVSSGHETA
jgi:lipopolysaccharide transport system ATP-binding protein